MEETIYTYLESNTDCIFNPFINKELEPGIYIVYIWADYTYSNYKDKSSYIINVSSDNQFKLSKKSIDTNFSVLQEILSKSLLQLRETKKELTSSNSKQLVALRETKSQLESCKPENLTSVLLNRFQDTSFGILYLRNNLPKQNLIVKVTNKSINMYLLIPKNKPDQFTITLAPGTDLCIIGIRKKYYEEFCFDLEFTYKIDKKEDFKICLNPNIERRNSIINDAVNVKSPDSPTKHKLNYFDFVHSKIQFDLKKICAVINSKENALETYKQKYPEIMKQLLQLPDLLDFEEVIFYDQCLVEDEDAFYFGEWKVKNSFMKHGKGSFTFNNGEKYIGQMQNGLRHGIGKWFYPNGEIIEIQFNEHQEMDGIGTKTYKNGLIRGVEYESNKCVNEYDLEVNTKVVEPKNQKSVVKINNIVERLEKHSFIEINNKHNNIEFINEN